MKNQQMQYAVSGTIRDSELGAPAKGLKVRAYDKDFFRDQLLGEGVSDENGMYEILFRREDFTGPLIQLERHPDIFLLVFDDQEKLIFSSRQSVVVDARKNTAIDITLKRTASRIPSEISFIHGTAVNLKFASRLTAKDLVNAARLIRRPQLKVDNAELIQKAFPTLFHRHELGDDCGESQYTAIRLLLKERNAEGDLDVSDADNFGAGTTIHSFFTANIVVKYTLDAGNDDQLTGAFATLPAADSNFTLPDGTSLGTIRFQLADLHPDNTEVAPTYVQKVGLIAEHALSRYITAAWGFSDPRNGAARLEYRLLKQATGIAGQTNPGWSHVETDIDNSDAQNFGTVPHEMFHQVQYRYNTNAYAAGKIRGVVIEGGARFIEDNINDAPNRYVQSAAAAIDGIFPNPGNSLVDVGGVGTPIKYAAALFWKYIAEHHSPNTGAAAEPAIGIESFRFLLEEAAAASADFTSQALRNARAKMPWYGTFDQFGYYDAAATELGSHETTWGNYLLANYLHRLMQPGDADFDQRFDYLEDDDATGPTILNTLAPAAEGIVIAQGSMVTRVVNGQNPYAAKYYEITPSGASVPRMLRINFSVTSGLADPIVQIIRLGAGDTLLDIHRSDRTNYSKTISMTDLAKVVVIVGSKDNGGDFTIAFDEVAAASDLMVTRWNTRVGTEYEVDPRGWAWHWISPDIIVDTDNDLMDDTEVFFGQDNKLKVRLRNRGVSDATNVRIDFWYQKATPFLTSAGWVPVQNFGGVTQFRTGLTVAAGAEEWFEVDWCPADDGTHHDHWCVKVLVTCATDPNSDNKMAFRNFSNVSVSDHDFDFRALIRYVNWTARDKIFVIPRDRSWTLTLRKTDEFPKPMVEPTVCACPVHRVTFGVPEDLSFATLKLEKAELKNWDGASTADPSRTKAYYPIDERTLPPGVRAKDIITLAHIRNGIPIGGVSYKLSTKTK